MIVIPKTTAAFVAFAAATLLPIFTAHADQRMRPKPIAVRVKAAEKVFVGVLVGKEIMEDDWCHAELKVTQAIKGCKVDELVPVVWRPKLARYDATIGQTGLAILQGKYKERYWNSFGDVGSAKEAIEAMKMLKEAEIEKQYVKGSVLTEELEKQVVELARRCGIKKVAKLSTYNLHPSDARGITVQGVEQIKDREVSYKVLQVRYKPWWHSGQVPAAGDLQLGEFWASQPKMQKQTILKVGKTEYRTPTIRDLSVEQCESVLGKFVAAKYTHGPDIKEGLLGQIDFTKPLGFRKQGDRISASFRHKGNGGGFFDLEVTTADDKLVIHSIAQAMP